MSTRPPDSDPDHSGANSGADQGPGAAESLVQSTYVELRRLAQAYLGRERPGHTLQPTALVHEAYLRLSQQDRARWSDRVYFLRIAGQVMRRILSNHARDRVRIKRGGGRSRAELVDVEAPFGLDPVELVALDEALGKLEAIDPRKVEVIQMRFFAGLSIEETAVALSVSIAQVKRDQALARAWLLREMDEGAGT